MPSDADRDSLLPADVSMDTELGTPRAREPEKIGTDDRNAIEAILRVMKPELEAFALRRGLQQADIDDLVNETVLTVLSKYGEIEGGTAGVGAVLRRTLKLNVVARARTRARAGARQVSEEDFEKLGVSDDPLAGLESKAHTAFLAAKIPTLSAPQSLVVLLRMTNHGWSYVAWICSIAEGHAVTIAAVKRRYVLAVEKLHGEYARVG